MKKGRKRLLAWLLVIGLFMSLSPMTAFAMDPATKWSDHYDLGWYNTTKTAYSATNSFSIRTGAELAAFAMLVNEGKDFAGKTVSLAADIDLSAHQWMPIGVGDLGSQNEFHFSGVFDGGNKAITMTSFAGDFLSSIGGTSKSFSHPFGLFGEVRGAEIKNLTILVGQLAPKSEANLNYRSVAALVGEVVSAQGSTNATTTITNCHAKGIDATSFLKNDRDYTGGLVAKHFGDGSLTVTDCSVDLNLSYNDPAPSGAAIVMGGILGDYDAEKAGALQISNSSYSGELRIEPSLTGDTQVFLGGISGKNSSEKPNTIANCFSKGSIAMSAPTTGDSSFGGIVGRMAGPDYGESVSVDPSWIDNCHSKMDVKGFHHVGGLAGEATRTRITNSSALGTVESIRLGVANGSSSNVTDDAGGLVGKFNPINSNDPNLYMMENCFASGKVINASETVGASENNGSTSGGLIGATDDKSTSVLRIKDCHATGDVEGYAKLGGLIGTANASTEMQIERCYATGNVSLKTRDTIYANIQKNGDLATVAGGFAGQMLGNCAAEIKNCYATGGLSAIQNNKEERGLGRGTVLGGFAGKVLGNGTEKTQTTNFEDCYYHGAISFDFHDKGYSYDYTYCAGFVGWAARNVNFTRCFANTSGAVQNKNAEYYLLCAGFAFWVDPYAENGNNSFRDCYAVSKSFEGFGGGKLPGTSGFGPRGDRISYANVFYDHTVAKSAVTAADDGNVHSYPTIFMVDNLKYSAWTDFTTHWDMTTNLIKTSPRIVDVNTSTYPTLKPEKFTHPVSELSAINAATPITVPVGTEWTRLPLPQTVTATTTDTPKTLVVDWDSTLYDNSAVGTIQLSGTVYFGTDLSNSKNEKANVNVTFTPDIQRAEISGEAKVAKTLNANGFDAVAGGNLLDSSALSYQWQSASTVDGTYTDIPSAHGASYTLCAADVGKFIQVKVSYYSKTATSTATASIAKGDMTAPLISEPVSSATQLEVTWGASNPVADSYQLYYMQSDTPKTSAEVIANNEAISSNTTSVTVTGLTKGKTYYLAVLAHKAGYQDAVSEVKVAIPNSFPTNAGTSISTPASTSDLFVGEEMELTANTDGEPVTYTWGLGNTSVGIALKTPLSTTKTQRIVGESLSDQAEVSVNVTSTMNPTKMVSATKKFRVVNAFEKSQTFSKSEAKAGEEISVTPKLVTRAASVIFAPTYSYQWKVAVGKEVGDSNPKTNASGTGSTTAKYNPASSEAGKYLFVEITLTNNGKTEKSVFLASNSPIAEANPTGVLTISAKANSSAGGVSLGVVQTATKPDAAAYAGKKYSIYYMQHNPSQAATVERMKSLGTKLAGVGTFGSAELTATVPAAVRGGKVDVITFIKADNYGELYSNIVEVAPLATITSVTIGDVTTVAQRATAAALLETGSGTDSVCYQWQRSKDAVNWNDITGATNKTYTIENADYNQYIRVSVSGDNVLTTGKLFSNAKQITAKANTSSHGGSSSTTTVPPKPSVNGGTATVSTSITATSNSEGIAVSKVESDAFSALLQTVQAAEADKKDALMEIKVVTPAQAKGADITIPKAPFQALADKTNSALKISSGIAVVSFDAKAVEAINASAQGDISIQIRSVNKAHLPEEVQKQTSDRPVYDFTVRAGNAQISSFGGGKANIQIPYSLKAGEDKNAVVVYYIDDAGKLQTVRGAYHEAQGTVDFSVSHFSCYAIGYNKVSFSDVQDSAWYRKAVTFLSARDITNGTDRGKFGSELAITRADFMVMLMRAYQIEPEQAVPDGFADAGNTYYTGYLAEAKKLGITNGVGNNCFEPLKNISRQDMFTLLYRTLDTIGELPQENQQGDFTTFSDSTSVSSYARKSMELFVSSGIIMGNNNKLNPQNDTSRAEMAQLLYKLLSK